MSPIVVANRRAMKTTAITKLMKKLFRAMSVMLPWMQKIRHSDTETRVVRPTSRLTPTFNNARATKISASLTLKSIGTCSENKQQDLDGHAAKQ